MTRLITAPALAHDVVCAAVVGLVALRVRRELVTHFQALRGAADRLGAGAHLAPPFLQLDSKRVQGARIEIVVHAVLYVFETRQRLLDRFRYRLPGGQQCQHQHP